MKKNLDKNTLEFICGHIRKNYIDKPQGRLLRVCAENIVDDIYSILDTQQND